MEGSITQLGLSNYLIDRTAKKHSFFHQSYRNYANFATDTRRVNFRNNATFGSRASMRLDEDARYGDLITNIQLEITLPDVSNVVSTSGRGVGYCNGVGNAIVKNVELRINSELIDAHPPIWRDIWSQLSVKPGQQDSYKYMVKKFDNWNTNSFKGGIIYMPFQFWFSQIAGDYDTNSWVFPLVSFANNTIEINIDFDTLTNILVSEDGSPLDTSTLSGLQIVQTNLIIDYVILEEAERVSYIERPRQLYLMNQLQYQSYSIPTGTTSTVLSMKSFNYQISEIIFVLQLNSAVSANDYFNYTNSTNVFNSISPFVKATLTFDGRDKFRDMDTTYFTQLIPSKCHTNTYPRNYIHCYSFALEPENFIQPTGVCNFSEIHEPLLIVDLVSGLPSATIWVFALNYNVLQTNRDGGVWLLHSMSKNMPTRMPDENTPLPEACQSLN